MNKNTSITNQDEDPDETGYELELVQIKIFEVERPFFDHFHFLRTLLYSNFFYELEKLA